MSSEQLLTAKSRYQQLENERRPYLDRGRQCAKLTIPTLLPPDGTNASSPFITPEQSIGARGVNNLSAKLLMALFPPNAPYLKMEVDAMTAMEMAEQEGVKDEIDKAFSQYVRRIIADFEARNLRSSLYGVFRQLVVCGNATLYVPPEGRARVYRLDNYVVSRDPIGQIMEWVGVERVSRKALPEAIAVQIPQDMTHSNSTANVKQDDDFIDLYTYVGLNEVGSYSVYQEAGGAILQGTEGEFSPDELPFLVLRYNKVDGESYGRGLIEEYLGDLVHLETLSKSLREFVAIASRVIPLINPNGTLTAKDLVSAQNGEPIIGTRDEVTFLQIERYNDFRVAKEMVDKLEQSLSFAFLMNTAIQRSGERVTAEEIRYMARELEDTLGGTYSLLSVELQLPLALIQIAGLEASGSLPQLPKNMTSPKVVTGMDALGRGNDLSNLMQFLEIVQQSPAAQSLKWDQIALRLANGLNIETDGLLMSAEEIAAMQQQQQLMAMAEQVAPNVVDQLGGMAQEQMQQQNQGVE